MSSIENNLSTLSESERQYALKILQELANNNESKSYNKLLLEDYNEIPVDIHTFLHDPNYLGKALTTDDGRFTLYPYWEELLHKIYPDPLKPAQCNTLALTGAIGLGKSTEAVIIGCYELYRMMCLRDPYVYYGIMNIDTISFAVVNITLDAAHGVAWSKWQQLLQQSPWFMANGELTHSSTPEWRPKTSSKIELIVGSVPRHFIGRALFFSFFDEISFVGTSRDVEKQKAAASELVNEASARMQSRFMKNDVNPTIMVLASSKRTDQSFLESWIDNKKAIDSKTTIVIDEPQWVVRPDKQSKTTFKVAVGNKFLQSEVLGTNVSNNIVETYKGKGYQILDVPIGYYENFLSDIDIAMTEIAGISTSDISSFIAGSRIQEAKRDSFSNLFTKDIIEVGNDRNDPVQYWDFFEINNVDKTMLRKPLFMHLDMSLSGDKTGIAGVWLKGRKKETNEPVFQLAFVVSVKAPKGYQVSFEKTRSFIYWLKQQHFNVSYITMDTYQSADMLQALIDRKFNAEVLSVDRVDKSDSGGIPVCKPYSYLKNAIYEQRLLLPHKGSKLLTEELIGLERNNNTGKVDHSIRGINSKDSADAVCGATWTASLHASEFSTSYVDDLELAGEINIDDDNTIETLTSQFESSLIEQKRSQLPKTSNTYIDFGYGQSIEMSDIFDINSGIISW